MYLEFPKVSKCNKLHMSQLKGTLKYQDSQRRKYIGFTIPLLLVAEKWKGKVEYVGDRWREEGSGQNSGSFSQWPGPSLYPRDSPELLYRILYIIVFRTFSKKSFRIQFLKYANNLQLGNTRLNTLKSLSGPGNNFCPMLDTEWINYVGVPEYLQELK